MSALEKAPDVRCPQLVKPEKDARPALGMQPLPLLVPPEHAPGSQVAPAPVLQSASEQHAAPLSVHRPLSFTHVPPGQEPGATVPQPPPAAQLAPGVVPPTQRIASRSPARKMLELSGRL